MVENLEKAKNSIRQELDAVLKVAAQQYHDDDKISDEANQAICNVIESVFIHGLKDAFFLKGSRYSKYPEPNFWPFVSKFTHRSIQNQIKDLKQIKSEIGKARAWIRIVLNEGQLEHYISLLSKDVRQLENFYVKNAFLRDGERLEALMGYLKALAKLPIKAPINSSFLNSWTPSPLILAGLITGKPQRVTVVPSAKKKNPSSNNLEEEEVEEAVNALDLLDETTNSESPASPFRKSYVDDDNSSVYSHTSLLEPNPPIGIPCTLKPTYSPFLSSTPENRPLEHVPLFNLTPDASSPTEVLVNRRKTTRVRKISKGSGSDESRRGSLTHLNAEMVPLSSSLPNNTGLMSFREMEKVMSKEKSVPALLGMVKKESYTSDSPIERPLLSTENSIDENDDFYIPPKSTKPVDIFGNQKPEDHNDTVTFGTSLHDEIIAAGYDPNSTSTSTMPGTSPSSGPGSSTGNSLATKGWSVSSRNESVSSEVSSLENSFNFGNAMKDILKERRDSFDEVGTLTEALPIIGKIEEVEKEDPQDSEVAVLKKSEELKQTIFEKIKEDKNEPVVIEENTFEGTDEYGITRNTLTIFTEIAIEQGLDKQDYRCLSCRKSIGGPFGKFNMCWLDARYYCDECWKRGDENIIPARVVLNWDCKKRPISKASKAFLKANADRPLIRIDKVNPELYEHSKLMTKILKLREKLSLVVVYLLSCKQSVAEDLKRRVWPQDYLYSDVHLYSFSDLENALTGVLERRLNSLIKFAISHVENCHLCLHKGFICELCSAKKIIYPFQMDIAERCPDCGAVYHIKCFKNVKCPKCLRRAKYSATRTELPLE